MPLKAIIFDVDGTLAETEEAHRYAFNRAFAEKALPWRWSEQHYAALLSTTGGRERIARHMAETGLDADPKLIADLHTRKNQIYADFVASGAVVPRPGILRLIAEAQRLDIKLAIATTTSRANLAALLEHGFGSDARTWFSAIVAGEDVAAKKPDPEVYHRVLSILSLEPADCIAIEDSRPGLAAALTCGITTIVTASRYTASDRFPGAALVCDDLDGPDQQINVALLQSLLMSAAHPGKVNGRAL